MIKRISLLLVVALVAAMMVVATSAPAFAASLKQTCEASGGDWQKTGSGEFTCVKAENPGTDNPQAATPKADTTTQTGNGGGGGEARNTTSSNGCGQNNTTC